MRILHAARNIANQAGYAVAALRRMGHDAEVWEYDVNPFGFPADRSIDIRSGDPAIWWRTFLEATERFDVLHFHFARSLFPDSWGGVPPLWDLPIYRILGKKVFVTFHGSDIRVRRIHLEVNPYSYYRTSDIRYDDDRATKVTEVWRTYADAMFMTSPDYLHFVPDGVVMPRIIDLGEWPEQAPDQRAVPRILHVPSRRGTKGTDEIVKGIEQLRSEGLEFEFEFLEGVPHAEAKRAIQAADIVVDNLITGDYELVSMEAMASSRVAVAHIAELSRQTFPDAPVYSVDPPTFVERMRTLVPDIDLRRSLAVRGRAYVATNHDAPVIAARLVEYYERPSKPVQVRAFPDWLSLEGSRKIERLERELAAARVREFDLRRKLGLPIEAPDDRTLKDRLPMPLRLALRRARARVTQRLRRR
jgi:glycosyltransferase involved in cell wall biosynthesis